MKKMLISLGIIILIAAIGFYTIKGTIYYSMFQIYRSIQNHDVETFEIYVDLDSVLDNLGDDLQKSIYDSMAKEMQKEEYDEWSVLGATMGFGAISMMMPRLIEESKKSIRREIIRQIEKIERLRESAEVKEKSTNEEKPDSEEIFDKGKLELKEIFSRRNEFKIIKKGKVAKLETNVKREDGKSDIIIHMRNMPGRYWRVVRLEIPELFKAEPMELEKTKAELIKPDSDIGKNGSGIQYTIQAASFSSEDTAGKEVIKLQSQNTTAYIQKRSNYFILCLGLYNKLENAKTDLKRYRKAYPDAFIREK